MKKAPLFLLLALSLAACQQSIIETKPPAPSTKELKTQIDEQECQRSSKFKGLKYLSPFFSSETEAKYNECMKRRGYPVPPAQ